jgi:hypothetical protein
MNSPESSASADPSADCTRLEKLLREASQHYIEDSGFTQGILVALPPSPRRAERRRSALLIGAGLLGCGHVAVLGGSGVVAFLSALMERLAAWSALPVPGLGASCTAGVLACWVLAAAAGGWAWARSR